MGFGKAHFFLEKWVMDPISKRGCILCDWQKLAENPWDFGSMIPFGSDGLSPTSGVPMGERSL